MGEWVGLPGDDGARGYLPLRTPEPTGALLVLHAGRGLDGSARRLADRLAGAGFAVLAPDLYRGAVAHDASAAAALRALVPGDRAARDVLAAWEALGALAPRAQRGALGLATGAACALWLAGARRGVGAVVLCEGTGVAEDVPAGTPVLGHFAAADAELAADEVDDLARRLERAGCAVAFHRYAGADRGFLDEERASHHPAAAELAWSRTLGFLCSRLAA